jgi:DNA invertase Pin-like site-specific DNA recombinase
MVFWLLIQDAPFRRPSRYARANGTKLGRRPVEPAVEARILELKASGDGILKIGRKLGIGTSVVQRVFKQRPRPT